jgi:3-oxoacyl-[acyl-carrier protein] reductase
MSAGFLAGKTVLVTGAANGIGEAMARLFCAEGGNVWLLDRDESRLTTVVEELRHGGAQAHLLLADLTHPTEVEAAMREVHGEVEALDVLVNNAGVDPRCNFLEMEEKDWLEVLDINLNGVYRCTREAARHMVRQRRGRIIQISSVTFFWGLKHLTHYVASKGALIGFTRALARELGEFNVHVNCITPGAIQTEREARTVTPEQAAEVITLQSLKRRITPLDVARTSLFLATEWSDGITGQTINVDGGWIMH